MTTERNHMTTEQHRCNTSGCTQPGTKGTPGVYDPELDLFGTHCEQHYSETVKAAQIYNRGYRSGYEAAKKEQAAHVS
jgi:hypothetical protein